MPPRQLVVEFVAANLAREVRLSIPDFSIVDIPADLIEYFPELQGEINDGYAFASRFIAGAAETSFAQAHNPNVVPLQDRKIIYLFDRWIVNVDRTLTEKGGNVNMLYALQRISTTLLTIIFLLIIVNLLMIFGYMSIAR